MKVIIFIPAYNEAAVIATVLRSLPATLPGVDQLLTVVVDDGSTDATGAIAARAGALVLTHPLNSGVGVAKVTGFAAARQLSADIMVTMDADGQHDPANLPALVAPIIADRADIVAGTRLGKRRAMPLIRRLGNRLMNMFLNMAWGVQTSDSQSGYRAYSRKALATLDLRASGFEVDTEILILAKSAALRVLEVPITTI